MKKLTRNPDGSTTYTNDEGSTKKGNGHDTCMKADQIDYNSDNIETIFNRINGTDGNPGMYTNIHLINEKLAGIITKQKSIEGWTKAVLSIFVLLVGIGIVMFIKIEQFPANYVAKSSMNQWADELREQSKLMQKMALSSSDSIVIYRKQLELMQSREYLFTLMRTTRGGKAKQGGMISTPYGLISDTATYEQIKELVDKHKK